jgi:chaperone protein EcpD
MPYPLPLPDRGNSYLACQHFTLPTGLHFMFGFIRKVNSSRPVLLVITAVILCVFYSASNHAALVINGTRIVYDGDKRSVSAIISNPSKKPFAVQTWVNTASDDTTTTVPFIPSPALFRLNAGKEQHVQINILPHQLPDDRESVFYFNVQEIPQTTNSEGGVLNIALRTRIKLFYRPALIKNNPQTRLKELQWSIKNNQGKLALEVYNPTPYFVSFIRLDISSNGYTQSPKNPAMAAPLSRQVYPLNNIKLGADTQVLFSTINDYGGYSPPLTAPVAPAN